MTRLLAAGCALLCAAAGCDGGSNGGGDGGTGTADKVEFACELGVLGEGGEFVEATGQARAELNLGFQGFLFVVVRLRATGDVPATVEATTSVTVEGDAPIGAREPELDLVPDGEAFLSSDLLLFFNSDVPADLEGRTVELAVKLEDATRVCTATGNVLLVDDDPCIHTGDEPICPDDSGTGTTDTDATETGTTDTGSNGTTTEGTSGTGGS